MRNYQAYEFKDLNPELQEKVRERFISQEVEFNLEGMQQDSEELTEEEFQAFFGCSKYYAETTAWFVPSCYYEAHKEDIDEIVQADLNRSLFNRWGTVIDSL